MDELYQLSIALAKLLQEAYPQLLGAMRVLDFLGDEEFFLVFLPAVYWCVDKRLGRQLGYIFLASALINNILKELARLPRPFWLEPSLQRIEEDGYGMPSGHVQNVTAVALMAAAFFRRVWVWALALLYILFMAFSRLYLGTHFLQDIAVGFAVGLLIFGAFPTWQRFYLEKYSKQILGRRLLLMVIVPLALAAVYVAIRLLLGAPDGEVAWAAYIPAAELNAQENIVSSVAALFGFGIGVVLESSRIRSRADGPAVKRVTRYVLGIAVTVAIWAGLRAVFPPDPLWVALPLRFLRYFLLLLWVTYFAPWVFVRLRLASADEQSEIRVTL